MAGVLLTYHKTDEERANRLGLHLANRFGRDMVLRALDETGGEKWESEVAEAMAGAEFLLALIGPHLQGASSDALRTVLAAAAAQEKVVLPVFTGVAEVPEAKDLPQEIAPLAEKGLSLRDERWNDSLVRLIEKARDLVRPTRERAPLYSVQLDILERQEKFFSLLDAEKKPEEAVPVGREILTMLDRVLPLYPADTILLSTRGYTHRNLAVALSRLERHEEKDAELAASERVFAAYGQEYPLEPAAWDGKGSI
ncbi:MAG: TIR domain-containing protein, partial [Nitrospirota bacterium]|nr:TIR domain-containing protein [Nitrospirota bacterium]